MIDYDQKFNPDSFLSPDLSYAPVYIWVWNDICTRALIDEQLDEMQRLGIRAFYILPEPKEFRPDSMPTRLEPFAKGLLLVYKCRVGLWLVLLNT